MGVRGFIRGRRCWRKDFCGEHDRAIFCELREDAFAALRRRFARDKRIKTINLDGYTAAGAFVPPVERRGLVLIDPPFEQPNEFRAMFGAFRAALSQMADRRLCIVASGQGFSANEKLCGKFS